MAKSLCSSARIARQDAICTFGLSWRISTPRIQVTHPLRRKWKTEIASGRAPAHTSDTQHLFLLREISQVVTYHHLFSRTRPSRVLIWKMTTTISVPCSRYNWETLSSRARCKGRRRKIRGILRILRKAIARLGLLHDINRRLHGFWWFHGRVVGVYGSEGREEGFCAWFAYGWFIEDTVREEVCIPGIRAASEESHHSTHELWCLDLKISCAAKNSGVARHWKWVCGASHLEPLK